MHPPRTCKIDLRFAPGLWMHVESVVTKASRPHLLEMRFRSRWWSGELRYEIGDAPHGCLLRHRETLRPCLLLRPVTGRIEQRLRVRIAERLRDVRDVVVGPGPESGAGR